MARGNTTFVLTACVFYYGSNWVTYRLHICDGLMQEIRNSIANALGVSLSCINPSILYDGKQKYACVCLEKWVYHQHIHESIHLCLCFYYFPATHVTASGVTNMYLNLIFSRNSMNLHRAFFLMMAMLWTKIVLAMSYQPKARFSTTLICQ